MKRGWSLERRFTVWFTGLTVAMVGMIVVLSTFFVMGATSREFEAVASEEIDELRAIFRDRALTHETMAEEAKILALNHPGVRVAWRIWNPETDEIWGEFGEPNILPPLGERPNEPWIRLREVPFGNEATGATADGPLWIGMFVDGRGRLFPLKKYAAIAGMILLGAGMSALLAGAMIGRRTAGLLEKVADRVQASGTHSGPQELEGNPPIEIQRVADSLAEALLRARNEQERSSFLIAGIAHELRSPIQNLLGETEIALMRERSPEQYKATLESHSEELQELAREIDNLVTLCAHSSNRAARNLEEFDLQAELELRLPREELRANRRGVALETRFEGDLHLSGDREALLLMIRNLVGNAIGFSPSPGRVVLTAQGEPDRILLAVEDAGPGVAPEHRERIFEPFRKGSEAPGSRAGFGLGLALAKEAVEASGGTLRVEDSSLGGARFVAEIPRKPRG